MAEGSESETEFYYFKSEAGGADGAGSKWIFKGRVPAKASHDIIRGMASNDRELIANALGTVAGEGQYMVFPQNVSVRIDVVAKQAFKEKVTS